MKGLRGKVITVLVAAFSVAGAALITYVVENGILPAWFSRMIAWSINFVIFEVSVPVWAALSFIFLLAMSLYWIVRTYEQQICEEHTHADKCEAEYRKLKSHCEELKKSNLELEDLNVTLTAEHKKLDAFNTKLIADNAELGAVNAQLNKSENSTLQTQNSEKLNIDTLSQEQLSVFDFLGSVLDSGNFVHVSTVMRGLRISVLTAEHILDSLCELGAIEKYSSLVEADSFFLTPTGRSCYLDRKRNTPINSAPLHG